MTTATTTTRAAAVLAFFGVVLLAFFFDIRLAHAETFTVNSTGDAEDQAPGGVCNTAPFPVGTEPECTLRAAIQEANATTTADTISFNIGGSGVKIISPASSSLPAITQPVTIDGYSEPGATENTETQPGKTNAVLKIQLRGSSTSSGSSGLTVFIGVSDTVIRGLAISNFGTGITLLGSGSGNRIEGNFIGADPSGVSAVGNGDGVQFSVANGSTLGGTSPDKRNLISGNENFGVWLEGSSSGNGIEGNLIGTDRNGGALGNGDTGVLLSSSGSAGNRILSNSISSNGALGIDLGLNGVTANDPGDADTGPNNLQNFPVLTRATTSRRGAAIRGRLNSTPNTTFTLQLFSNPRGENEGKKLIAQRKVTTDAAGNASFFVRLGRGAVGAGQFVTATATDPGGNTSEFSARRRVVLVRR